MSNDTYDSLLAGTHAPLSKEGGTSSTKGSNKSINEKIDWKVKLYHTTLSLAKIEQNVPPNILLQFISSYLVQTPTVVQILQYYQNKRWGEDELKTSRIMCSLSVNLEPIAAKRAAVKWAERQLEEVSDLTESSEYKRLVHGWHLALEKAEMGEVAHKRRAVKKKLNKKDDMIKAFEAVETKFEKGRDFQRKRFEKVLDYHEKYNGIGRQHGKIRKMQEVLDTGSLRDNAKNKLKHAASIASVMTLFGSKKYMLKPKALKRLKHLRLVMKVRDKLVGSIHSRQNSPTNNNNLSPLSSDEDNKKSFVMPPLKASSSREMNENDIENVKNKSNNLVPARPEYDNTGSHQPSVNIKMRTRFATSPLSTR